MPELSSEIVNRPRRLTIDNMNDLRRPVAPSLVSVNEDLPISYSSRHRHIPF